MCACCAGYANECGEAFRPLVPVEIVYFTYFLAISYVLADTVDKGKKGAAAPGDDSTLRATFGAVDTFMWQAATSLRPPPLLTPHAPRLTPHSSRLTPRASRLTPHASLHAAHCAPCGCVWQMLASVLFPSFIINRLVTLLFSLQAGGVIPNP